MIRKNNGIKIGITRSSAWAQTKIEQSHTHTIGLTVQKSFLLYQMEFFLFVNTRLRTRARNLSGHSVSKAEKPKREREHQLNFLLTTPTTKLLPFSFSRLLSRKIKFELRENEGQLKEEDGF